MALDTPAEHSASLDPLLVHEQYPPIADYALIGDCRCAALVSSAGAIEWLCLPHFSGPAVFAACLDRAKGGSFSIRPTSAFRVQRRYREHSNVLETVFLCEEGSVKVTDAMIIDDEERRRDELHPQRELLRIVEGLSGRVELSVRFEPRPDFGQATYRLRRGGRRTWVCRAGGEVIILHSDTPLKHDRVHEAAEAAVQVGSGERLAFSLTYAQYDIGVTLPLGDAACERIEHTDRWWRQWCAQCTYSGPYEKAVHRSALTLKMLTFGLSGAVVAAPTTSLPEHIGGVRNWDYRYCWLRDAALTLRAFMDVGFHAEGKAFLAWLLHATSLTWPKLQVMYDVYGETKLKERTLDHLEGYRGSKPVRIGNDASNQLQLDVYGEVVLAAHSYVRRGGSLSPDEARHLLGFGKVVCKEWKKTDHGIWEFRDDGRHNTYSKLMCWVALNSLIELHEEGHVRIPKARFEGERASIRAAIDSRGFNAELNSYVTAFDSTDVDASLLLLAQYGYIDPQDARMQGTFARIEKELAEDFLVYRYREGYDDFLPPGEGAFVLTSFWAADYLARIGELDASRYRFERLLGCANDLDLLAEEIDPKTGEALGNFPQAFSHIGLICAALSICAAQKESRHGDT